MMSLGLGVQRLTGPLRPACPSYGALVVVARPAVDRGPPPPDGCVRGPAPAWRRACRTRLAPGSTARRSPRRADAATCVHCGLPVPPGFVESGDRRAVLLRRMSYRIRDPDCTRSRPVLPAARASRTGRAFHRPVVPGVRPRGLSRPLRHDRRWTACSASSCTSRASTARRASGWWSACRCCCPGVARAELDVRRSLAVLEWDAATMPLSSVARTLDSLGYPPHPFRGVRREEVRRREDRAVLVRIGVAGAIAINVMLAGARAVQRRLVGMDPQYQRFFRWVSLVVTVPAMLWPGRVFFTGALGGAAHAHPAHGPAHRHRPRCRLPARRGEHGDRQRPDLLRWRHGAGLPPARRALSAAARAARRVRCGGAAVLPHARPGARRGRRWRGA